MPLPYGSLGFPITAAEQMVFGGPLNFSYANDYQGNTTYIGRVTDCNIYGWTLSTADRTSGSIYNKIFTPSIFLNDKALKPNNGSNTPASTDIGVFGIVSSSLNPISLDTQSTRGCTLYIKYGYDLDPSTDQSFVPYDNVRERGFIYNSAAFTGYIGITKNGFTFTVNRYQSISLGLRNFSNSNPGMTGVYTYYLINGHPNNYGELIWRVQFSFGGTSGNLTPTTVQLWDALNAWNDIYGGVGVRGTTYWSNADGCMQGLSGGLVPKTDLNPSGDGTDPFPRTYDPNIDFVQ
jgi:hypothetical protein